MFSACQHSRDMQPDARRVAQHNRRDCSSSEPSSQGRSLGRATPLAPTPSAARGRGRLHSRSPRHYRIDVGVGAFSHSRLETGVRRLKVAYTCQIVPDLGRQAGNVRDESGAISRIVTNDAAAIDRVRTTLTVKAANIRPPDAARRYSRSSPPRRSRRSTTIGFVRARFPSLVGHLVVPDLNLDVVDGLHGR